MSRSLWDTLHHLEVQADLVSRFVMGILGFIIWLIEVNVLSPADAPSMIILGWS